MKNAVAKVLLALSSLLVIIFVGEACLRLYFYINPRPIYVDKKLGWKVTENFHDESFLKDAEGKGYYSRVTTNKYGFRLFGDPNSKKVKVFVVGDSFTLALAVSDNKTYYSLLAKKLKSMEFFVYGASGYGTLQEFMILDEYIDLINPHIVILQLCRNDFYDNYYKLERISYNTGMIRPYMDLQGNIFYDNPGNWPYVISILIPNSRLVRLIATKTKGLLQRTSHSNTVRNNEIKKDETKYRLFEESITITKFIMDKIKKRASNSIICAFSVNNEEPYLSELEKAALTAGFKLIDGVPETVEAYEQQGFTTRAADKAHWNELGHKIVADKIYDHLVCYSYVQNLTP